MVINFFHDENIHFNFIEIKKSKYTFSSRCFGDHFAMIILPTLKPTLKQCCIVYFLNFEDYSRQLFVLF